MVHTIKNCLVTIEDVHNANTIYGYAVPTLKGKTDYLQSKPSQTEYIKVPDSLNESIGKLKVATDVMFVNIIPFLSVFQEG